MYSVHNGNQDKTNAPKRSFTFGDSSDMSSDDTLPYSSDEDIGGGQFYQYEKSSEKPGRSYSFDDIMLAPAGKTSGRNNEGKKRRRATASSAKKRKRNVKENEKELEEEARLIYAILDYLENKKRNKLSK